MNSKTQNHSQAFQFSRSLLALLEELLEVKHLVDNAPHKYIEIFAKGFKNFQVTSGSPGIGKVLGTALYFSCKSLLKLHSLQRSQGKLDSPSLLRAVARAVLSLLERPVLGDSYYAAQTDVSARAGH
jgi:hypothetical protein